MDNIRSLIEKKRELDVKLEKLKSNPDVVNEIMHVFFKPVFDKHPRLFGFGFRAYTPYFNDGDECVFSAWLVEEETLVREKAGEDDSFLLDLNEEGSDEGWSWSDLLPLQVGRCLEVAKKQPQLYVLNNYLEGLPYSSFKKTDAYQENSRLEIDLNEVINDAVFHAFLEDHSEYAVWIGEDGNIQGERKEYDHE